MKKLVFAASEAVPFIKTGGLADVVGSLAKALESEADVVSFLPKYACLAKEFVEKMSYCGNFWMDFDCREVYVGLFAYTQGKRITYFIDNEEFFKTESVYTDNHFYEIKRFSFFSKAVLSSLKFLNIQADILHCHDWQTGLIPLYLRRYFTYDPYYQNMKCLFTIHNLRFQGKWNKEEFSHLAGINPSYWWGDEGNMLAAGIVYAERVSTVSTSYAAEIQTAFYGEGLDSLLREKSGKLSGILNGIDTESFHPGNDRKLVKNYTQIDFRQKKGNNKLALQKKMGLPQDKKCFTVGMVSRLTDQKGLDLVAHVLEEMLREDPIQFVVLGSGEYRYEEMFRYFTGKYPEKIASYIGYNDALARLIYAGCDAFLMPSLFEPCGLSQMIAMRYGSLPVVRETGGLKDSVEAYNEYAETGTGFSFCHYNAHEMMNCLRYARQIYSRHKASWNKIVDRAMATDYSWATSAEKYLALYRKITEE